MPYNLTAMYRYLLSHFSVVCTACHICSLTAMYQYVLSHFSGVFCCRCSVQACADVKYGKRVHILPIDDTVEGLTG